MVCKLPQRFWLRLGPTRTMMPKSHRNYALDCVDWHLKITKLNSPNAARWASFRRNLNFFGWTQIPSQSHLHVANKCSFLCRDFPHNFDYFCVCIIKHARKTEKKDWQKSEWKTERSTERRVGAQREKNEEIRCARCSISSSRLIEFLPSHPNPRYSERLLDYTNTKERERSMQIQDNSKYFGIFWMLPFRFMALLHKLNESDSCVLFVSLLRDLSHLCLVVWIARDPARRLRQFKFSIQPYTFIACGFSTVYS